jgi:hypothetical protein
MNAHVDLTDIRELEKWYKTCPGVMRKATANMLNNFAFGTRTAAIEQIAKVMTVRNTDFVKNRMRVTKASTSTPVEAQRSIAGSVATARFSGWTEQEMGTSTARKRFGTVAGRGGDMQKQLRPVVRLKPGRGVITIGSPGYSPAGGSSNYGGFIAMLIRKREDGLIRIKGVLLKRKGKKLEVVQVLRKKQPKRLYWLRAARGVYFSKTDLPGLWSKTISMYLGKPRLRG